ncbi:MAG: isopenicillin N synthase family dioxygenase [Candidatus Competibacterales bacterium]
MGYAAAKPLPPEAIPVVDIEPLRTGADPKAVAAALHAASTGLGFIYVKGHGIPRELIDGARRAAYGFFRAEALQKATVAVAGTHRGWLGRGGARMQDDAPVDLKESFIWGFEDATGQTPQDHPLRGANRWPDFLPALRHHSMAYFTAAHQVAQHLLRGFALGLDLAEDFFLRSAATPISRASYVYYPPQDAALGAEQFGVGPHTDFGVLTVLCQDDVGGLQVQDKSGDWLVAPPIDGTLVVNVGDLLARWTDGVYISTPHRVVNTSGRERLSLVLAFDPDPDTVIDSREIFGPDHLGAQPATTCGDYLLWRFERAFAYRQSASHGEPAP